MRKVNPFILIFIFMAFGQAALAQNVTVNPGGGSYATLKTAFDAINAGTHTGAVTVTIVANTTESATATLNASGSGSASYTSIVVSPSATVSVTGNLATPLISLNGADNVTINGLGTLTISNTSTSTIAGTSTIRFINDASNNTITNCILLGSSATAANTTTATGVVLFSTGTTTGNDNNIISNNDISSAGANLSSRGIASFGSAGFANSDNQVINNNVYNIFQTTYSASIQLNDNNINWTINNNRIYQAATRNGTGTGINYGIWVDGATVAEQFTITNNIIGYGTNTQSGSYKVTGASTTFQAISFTGKPTTVATTISGNTISALTISNTSTSLNYAINVNVPAAGGIPVTVSNNNISGISSLGNVYAISITGAGTNRASTITGNNINAITLTGTARFYGILYNGGDGGSSSGISSNVITDVTLTGTASGAATGSPALNVIYVASGPAIVTDNTIGSQTAQSISCIQTSGSTSSFDLLAIFVKGTDNNTISNNIIGGLVADNAAATSGTARIFGIRNSSSGTVTCSGNTIGGTATNSIQLNSPFTSASILAIYNSAGSSTFSENTIRNITSGAGTGTAANSSLAGIYNAAASTIGITGNVVYNLSSPGTSVAGIINAAGSTATIAGNTVSNISGSGSTGAPVVAGIQISGGTAVNVFKNKIYGISQSSASGSEGLVNGLLISGGTTVTSHNNIIGLLTAPAANARDAIRGISVTSNTPLTTYKIYYNTVYLNATSSGTPFGSSALFHIGNSVSTTATLDLKNNILVNTSTAAGPGVSAAVKRWPNGAGAPANLANYDPTSNNNLFYVSAGTGRALYEDSLNNDQTMAAFQARVTPRESASVTEMPPFASTIGTDATFLHLTTGAATLAESRGLAIAGITDDYDGNTRQGNAGYSGTGTAPDLGADEGAFTAIVLPVTLLRFNGEQQGMNNKLHWSTSTETNNKGFIIERGVDGKNFSSIASVSSKAVNGNSILPLEYDFTDSKAPLGSAYYRLRQTDRDGKISWSPSILIKRSTNELSVLAIFPNPATDFVNIALSSPKNQQTHFVITDLSGRVMLKQVMNLSKGDNMVYINLSRLAKGQYFVRNVSEGGLENSICTITKQ